MTTERTGQCLCKAITLTATPTGNVGACHCNMCRTWTGGPFMAIGCGTDVRIEGEDHIVRFDSSQWAERAFCGTCGTHLFYRLKGNDEHMLAAGLFGPGEGLVFDHQVFVDERPEWYSFAQETDDMTGPEIFATYGGD